MNEQTHTTPQPGTSREPASVKETGQSGFFQPKLKVGAPDDPHEREADQVADHVMRAPADAEPAFFKPAPVPLQRKCEHCEEEEKLQREEESTEETGIFMQAAGDGEPTVTPAAAQAITQGAGKGNPLPTGTKDFMENRFGRSFDEVRLHTDGEAAQLSAGLHAQAFTHGKDIYFNAGRFDPASSAGKHLLAHELTHVVQQSGGPRSVQRAPNPPDQDKSLQVWKDAVILEQTYHKVWVDHLYPGTLVTGYVHIELIHVPADVTSQFLPPEAMGGGQKGVSIKMPEEGVPVELPPIPKQPDYFEWRESTGKDVKTPNTTGTLPSPPKAGGKGVVIRVNRRIEIVTRNKVRATIVMSGNTSLPPSFNITQLNARSALEQVLNYPIANASLQLLFNYTFPGDEPDSADPINEQRVTSLNDLIRTYAPDLAGIDLTPYQQYNAAIHLLLAYVPHAAIVLQDYSRKMQDVETKTLAEAEKYIQNLGKRDGITVQSPDGKFHTSELTQMELFNALNELRLHQGERHEINWRTSGNKVKVEKIFLNGKEISIRDAIDNLYYVDPDAAAAGNGKAAGEAIIYRMMNSGFYARKPVTHDEAMKLWNDIDDRIEFPEKLPDITHVPDGIFVALYAKGTGEYHTINADYVEGKRRFMKSKDDYDRDVKVKSNTAPPEEEGSTPLMFDIYETAGGGKILQYIEAQLDKGVLNDTAFRDVAKDRKYLQSSLSLIVMNKMNNAGNRLALDIITKAHNGLKTLLDDDDAFRALIMRFPDMSEKDQNDTLSILGVEAEKKDVYRKILADKKTAYQIAFGITVKTIGLTPLRSGLRTVTTELATAKEQITKGQLNALLVEGDFGNVIRTQIYKQFGFTKLTAETFPHHDQTQGVFPTALSGNALDYSGMMEQIYANFVAHSDNAMTVMKVTVITLMALVTAAIAIASGGIGTGVAAVFFTEGTAAFTATSIGVSALSMTVMGEAFSQTLGAAGVGPGGALGKDKEYYGAKELGKSFLENLAMSTIFTGLGSVMKNASAVWRISATGAAFIGYSLGRRIITGEGIPKGRELPLFIYEQLITLAAIEAGSVLARPMLEMFYTKGLSLRVTRINEKITALKTDIAASQTKLADILSKGDADNALKIQHLGEQRGLLEKYLGILREIKEAKDIQYDRDVDYEIKLAENALEKIRFVEFQQKVGFRQNRFAGDKVSYKPGDKAVQDIKDYYGENNVTGPDKDGMLKVKTEDGKELNFYPETKEKEVNRSILERPATKLPPDVAHSINVTWTNIGNVPGMIIYKGSKTVAEARDFWNETGPNMYDQVYTGEYYIKYDTTQGRLLLGEIQTGRILGFFLDEGRIYPTAETKTLVNDPMKDMGIAVEKLQRYYGLKDPTIPLKGNFSSKAVIVADPNRTTTILGAYVVEDNGKVVFRDMPQLFDNFGNLKNADFGAKKGGFNVLNVGEGFYEPGSFFDKYNRPWLLEAIQRDDIFYVASDPTQEIFIFKRDKSGNWLVDKITGERLRTGFGKEVKILEDNGYKYDPVTKTYKK